MTRSEPIETPGNPLPDSPVNSNPAASAAAPEARPTDPMAPEASASAAAPNLIKLSLDEQLAAAKKEAADYYDRYVRAVADLENFRRRVNREKDELRQFATANLLQHLLPVLDNLQLGLTAARQQTDAKTITDGISLVWEQFKGVLSRHGVKEVDPVGHRFDPHLHESLAHQPSIEVPEEHVLQVVRIGFILHGRLLRPASVILSSGPAKEVN